MDWLLTSAATVGVLVLGALVGGGITFMSQRLNREANVEPVLVFYKEKDDKYWSIENVGNGPALNISIAAKNDQGSWRTFSNGMTTLFLPSLAKGVKQCLAYTTNNAAKDKIAFDETGCHVLMADYESSLKRRILTVTQKHRTTRVILSHKMLECTLCFPAAWCWKEFIPPSNGKVIYRYDLIDGDATTPAVTVTV